MSDDNRDDVLAAYEEASRLTKQLFGEMVRSTKEQNATILESMRELLGEDVPLPPPPRDGGERTDGCRQRISRLVRDSEYMPFLEPLYRCELTETWGRRLDPSPGLRPYGEVRLRVSQDETREYPSEAELVFRCELDGIHAEIRIDRSEIRTDIQTPEDEEYLDETAIEATVRLFMTPLLSPRPE